MAGELGSIEFFAEGAGLLSPNWFRMSGMRERCLKIRGRIRGLSQTVLQLLLGKEGRFEMHSQL